jgi:hypothetical protein
LQFSSRRILVELSAITLYRVTVYVNRKIRIGLCSGAHDDFGEIIDTVRLTRSQRRGT